MLYGVYFYFNVISTKAVSVFISKSRYVYIMWIYICPISFSLFSSVIMITKTHNSSSGFTVMRVKDLIDFFGILDFNTADGLTLSKIMEAPLAHT